MQRTPREGENANCGKVAFSPSTSSLLGFADGDDRPTNRRRAAPKLVRGVRRSGPPSPDDVRASMTEAREYPSRSERSEREYGVSCRGEGFRWCGAGAVAAAVRTIPCTCGKVPPNSRKPNGSGSNGVVS